MKETEIAKDVVSYLKDFDLYYEVMDVDIIAKMDNRLTAVEVKTSLNFKVIEQAFYNKMHFHYSYIAIPHSKNRSFAYQICTDYGIGVLELRYHKNTGEFCDVVERVRPVLNRKVCTKHIVLTEEDKKSIPGASGKDGTTRTAFKITLEEIEAYIKRHQGCTFKEMFEKVDHHYASFTSARSSTKKWIDAGVIKTIYIEDGRLQYRET